jgi:hypothetical protein
MEEEYSKRGVKTKLLGFIMIVLGVLDSLLTLRGGIPAYEFLLLIFAGTCIFAIGAIRAAQPSSTQTGQSQEI